MGELASFATRMAVSFFTSRLSLATFEIHSSFTPLLPILPDTGMTGMTDMIAEPGTCTEGSCLEAGVCLHRYINLSTFEEALLFQQQTQRRIGGQLTGECLSPSRKHLDGLPSHRSQPRGRAGTSPPWTAGEIPGRPQGETRGGLGGGRGLPGRPRTRRFQPGCARGLGLGHSMGHAAQTRSCGEPVFEKQELGWHGPLWQRGAEGNEW